MQKCYLVWFGFQKEFDRKLKAKRAIFSRGRSISLASFKAGRSINSSAHARQFSEDRQVHALVVSAWSKLKN